MHRGAMEPCHGSSATANLRFAHLSKLSHLHLGSLTRLPLLPFTMLAYVLVTLVVRCTKCRDFHAHSTGLSIVVRRRVEGMENYTDVARTDHSSDGLETE